MIRTKCQNMLRWSGQNANQKVGTDKMPTTKKNPDKMPTFGWHYVRLAFCPVGILSYHRCVQAILVFTDNITCYPFRVFSNKTHIFRSLQSFYAKLPSESFSSVSNCLDTDTLSVFRQSPPFASFVVCQAGGRVNLSKSQVVFRPFGSFLGGRNSFECCNIFGSWELSVTLGF